MREPRHLKPVDVLALLATRQFHDLIGAIEDQEFDAKLSPYVLNDDSGKFELAKDICAFANADGGVIVLGFDTDDTSPTHPYEVVNRVEPFPLYLFDVERYRAVLRAWTYPALDSIEMTWYESPEAAGRGVAALHVPPTGNRETYLITRSISGGKADVRMLAFSQRVRAGTANWSPQHLHSMIHIGRSGSTDHIRRMEAAVSRMEALSEPRKSGESNAGSPPIERPSIEARVEAAISDAGLGTAPTFYLAADPIVQAEVREFLEADGLPARLLKQPPEIRPDGFDLDAGSEVQFRRGEVQRTVVPNYKLLEIFRDGAVVFVGRGDGQYLAWGPKKHMSLNPLALAEATYLFVTLVQSVVDALTDKPEMVTYCLGLRRMGTGDARALLNPHRVSSVKFADDDQFASSSPDDSLDLKIGVTNDVPAERVAAQLVEEVYGWFNIPLGDVPYLLKTTTRGRLVDVEMMRSPIG